MEVKITSNIGPVLQRFDELQKQTPAAIQRALIRTRDEVTRPAIVEAVSADTGLSPSTIGEALSVTKPSQKDLVATIRISSKRVPLMDFDADQTSTGVTYRLPGGQGFVPHAFIARMQSRHVGVFKRRVPSVRRGRGAWSLNLPIVELHGPSVARVVEERRAVVDAVTDKTVIALPEFLEQEFLALEQGAEVAAA